MALGMCYYRFLGKSCFLSAKYPCTVQGSAQTLNRQAVETPNQTSESPTSVPEQPVRLEDGSVFRSARGYAFIMCNSAEDLLVLSSSSLLSNLELSDTQYMSLKYEPSSEPLHVSVM